MQEPRNKQRKGFTVLELLIIIVIVAVITVAGIGALFKYRGSQDLKLALGEISSVIRETQRKSVTQEDGKRWGIRFENPENDRGQLKVFKGLNYASGTIMNTITIRRGVTLGEPYSSSTYDIVFLPVEGTTALKKVITLNTGIPGGLVGDLIVNLLGRVTSRSEVGFVGYWHLDEGTSTTAYDASGNGNNGVIAGTPIWVSGSDCKAGSCLNLDGTTNYITLPTSMNSSFLTEASIVFWAKLDSNTPGATQTGFLNLGNDEAENSHYPWTNGFLYLNTFRAVRWDGVNDGGFNKTNWHMIAITSAPGTGNYRFYRDAVLIASTTGDAVVAISDMPAIGKSFGSYYLDGTIDEVRLYNRALTAEEIGNIYSDLK